MPYTVAPVAYSESLLSISRAATQWAINHTPSVVGQTRRALDGRTGIELWRGTIIAVHTVPIPKGDAYVYTVEEPDGTTHIVNYATEATLWLLA